MTLPIRLVTCADLPDGDDEDGALLLAACQDCGLDAEWVVWNDERIDWAAPALTVIRSAWDYTAKREQFLGWAARIPELHNAVDVIDWNSDKRYLAQLQEAGVPVVPTSWAEPGATAELPEDGEFVVKPTVGAGSLGAGRFAAGDVQAARAHVDMLHRAGRTAMIQPYLTGVDAAGETALVFIDGQFSHAIAKAAMLATGTVNGVDRTSSRALFVAERITARAATSDQLALSTAVLHAAGDLLGLGEPLLYARVDLLPGPDGPVLIELELTEPSLFLSFHVPAAAALAQAIARRARRR